VIITSTPDSADFRPLSLIYFCAIEW
jgi:hypothetical protein